MDQESKPIKGAKRSSVYSLKPNLSTEMIDAIRTVIDRDNEDDAIKLSKNSTAPTKTFNLVVWSSTSAFKDEYIKFLKATTMSVELIIIDPNNSELYYINQEKVKRVSYAHPELPIEVSKHLKKDDQKSEKHRYFTSDSNLDALKQLMGIDNTNFKHAYLRDSKTAEKEIIRRTVAQWQAEEKSHGARFNRKKDELTAATAGQLYRVLADQRLDRVQQEQLKRAWKEHFITKTNEPWNAFTRRSAQHREEGFKEYQAQYYSLWTNFCALSKTILPAGGPSFADIELNKVVTLPEKKLRPQKIGFKQRQLLVISNSMFLSTIIMHQV